MAARTMLERWSFSFASKRSKQGEGVGAGAGETGDDPIVQQAANFDRVGLHDRTADRHLAIAAEGDHAVVPDAQNRRRTSLFRHICFRLE